MATGWPMKTTYANGDVYSASDVNDTNGTINLLGSSVAYTAGKNKILNSDFSIWQRGTSFTPTAGTLTYTADRFMAYMDGNGTYTVSRQASTPGAAPVAGYESPYFFRQLVNTKGTSTYVQWEQRIEDVRNFANQTITVSFWARLNSGTITSGTIYAYQNFGSGGSAEVYPTSKSFTPTASWARYSVNITMPSISGKTIGTGSFVGIDAYLTFTAAPSIDYWGVQVEQGSTATAFQTATGTIQGELAACQRYYYRITSPGSTQTLVVPSAWAYSSVESDATIQFPVFMRTSPSSVDFSNLTFSRFDNVSYNLSSVTMASNTGSSFGILVYATISGATAGNVGKWTCQSTASAYLGFSAEL
jgi:hypothetical protein